MFRTIKKKKKRKGKPTRREERWKKKGNGSGNKMDPAERSTMGFSPGWSAVQTYLAAAAYPHTIRRVSDETARAIRLGFLYRTDACRAPSKT